MLSSVLFPRVQRSAWFIWGALIYKGRLGVVLVKVVVLRSIIFLSTGVTEGRFRFTDDGVWPCRSSVTSKCLTEITQLPLLWSHSQALRVQLSTNPQTIWYPTGDVEWLIHVYAYVCVHEWCFSQALMQPVFCRCTKSCAGPWPHHLHCQTVTRQQVAESPCISRQAQSVVKYGHTVSDTAQQTFRSLDLSLWLAAILSVCRARKSKQGFRVLGQTFPERHLRVKLLVLPFYF